MNMRVGQSITMALLVILLRGSMACQKTPQPSDKPPPAPQAPAPAAPASVSPSAAPPAPDPAGTAGAEVSAPDFASLAARVIPAVVSIQVEQHIKAGQGRQDRQDRSLRPGPFGIDPFDLFRFFGQDMPPREYESHGLGSGFILEASGIILTNAHVVEKADSIEVTLMQPDGSEKRLGAKILGQAPEYDIAVIQTQEDAHATSVAVLGNSEKVRIGDWVMAIGNPFGLAHSASVGIISATQRRDIAPSGRQGVYDFLQTDASINPGNSGGPLVDLKGKVIGVNAAINAQGQGIGFAIPINMVKAVLPQLRKGGRFVRSWVGIKFQPLTSELAESYGLKSPEGVLVLEVVPKGPAGQAGLKGDDIILEFDGKKINSWRDLPLLASMAGVGKVVPVVVWRDKQRKSFSVTLEAMPQEEDGAASKEGAQEEDNKAGLGFVVSDITPPIRERLGIKRSRALLIEAVDPGSVAARAGLQRWDVIVELNGKPVGRAKDFIQQVKTLKAGQVLRLKIEREGSRSFVALRKPR